MTAPMTATLIALGGIPLVRAGDDVPALVLAALAASGQALVEGDALVVAQKIFSKAEGRMVRLAAVTPSPAAISLATETGKDPRLVELVLGESARVLRHRRDVLVVEHRLGFVTANAGIDMSNVAQEGEDDTALLLPADPDASCSRLRQALRERSGIDVPVIMNDSHGRAFRQGVVGVAIGVSGLAAVADLRGRPDLFGRQLKATDVAVADELAAAASLVMGQSDEGRPVVLARGFRLPRAEGSLADLIRPRSLDLFR